LFTPDRHGLAVTFVDRNGRTDFTSPRRITSSSRLETCARRATGDLAHVWLGGRHVVAFHPIDEILTAEAARQANQHLGATDVSAGHGCTFEDDLPL